MAQNNPPTVGSSKYYLSAYLSPAGSLSLLAPRHDQNICLLRHTGEQVELVRLWELERLTGQKHHYWPLSSFQRQSAFIEQLLASVDLSFGDITASWGTPGLPQHEEIDLPAASEQFPVHSLAHLFSGLLLHTDVFNDACIIAMAVDGSPDFVLETRSTPAWYAGAVAINGQVKYLPVESPAPLYSAARALFGLEPGTLMALSSATDARVEFDAEDALGQLTFFGGRKNPMGSAIPFVQAVEKEVRAKLGNRLDERFNLDENIISATMKAVQACCDVIMDRNIARLCEIAEIRPSDAYLSISGGFALNCPSNTRLLNKFNFKGLMSPPCVNDGGQAMGLGLLAMYTKGIFATAKFELQSAYVGDDDVNLPAALGAFSRHILSVEVFDPEIFANDLCHDVLAWVDGGAEAGPRALGHRSLLGDPSQTRTKDRLNEVKGRQWWRPVAPIVLEEHVSDWFATKRRSPYMLEIADIRTERLASVPAIAHLDRSARLQTIARRHDERLYEAIEAVYLRTGVPIVCNTSLNDKGEPIVNTATEALRFCLRKGLRIAYINGHRIALAPCSAEDIPALPDWRPEKGAIFAGPDANMASSWRSLHDAGYSDAGIFLLSRSVELRTASTDQVPPFKVNSLAEGLMASDVAFNDGLRKFLLLYGPNANGLSQGDGAISPDE